MATIKKNPALTDYFVESDTALSTAASLVPDYEAGKVITFPQLNLKIDHVFWASLPTNDLPGFKKLRITGHPPTFTVPIGDDDLRAQIERYTRDL